MSGRFAAHGGAFMIEAMPSQPQLALCHGFYVDHDKRGCGNGAKLKEYQNKILESMGYDFAICTVDSSNSAQKSILKKSGWDSLVKFKNRKTGGITEIWGGCGDWHLQRRMSEVDQYEAGKSIARKFKESPSSLAPWVKEAIECAIRDALNDRDAIYAKTNAVYSALACAQMNGASNERIGELFAKKKMEEFGM